MYKYLGTKKFNSKSKYKMKKQTSQTVDFGYLFETLPTKKKNFEFEF
jgi:hypothetical protein